MKSITCMFAIVLLSGCSKDEVKYPKSYTFSHLDQTEEGLFVLSDVNTGFPIDMNTGVFGLNREIIKQESEELIKSIFDIQEIELLSESTVRIRIIYDDEEVIDTIISYTIEDQTIIIEYFANTDFIYHDKESDQFILCAFTLVALPGPNVVTPGSEYNSILIEGCQEGASIEDHLNYILSEYAFKELDTIGIVINKFIYK